jgi:nitrogen PTS system EIIA component
MTIAQIMAPACIHLDVDAPSKKRALERMSEYLSEGDSELNSGQVFDALLMRERLGSTGLGFGFAIPHARHAHAADVRGACMRLAQPIDFDAMDQQPVDFVVGLLVPDGCADEHVHTLAQLAGLLNEPDVRARLRNAQTPEEVLEVFLSASVA